MDTKIYSYAGKLLRIDLNTRIIKSESFQESFLKRYIGGASLGTKYVNDEVPAGLSWFNAENRLFIGTGPLTGTRVGGSGSISVVTKGALTNGMTSTQANGFFGTYLKMSGFDAIIIQGISPNWVYIYIHDGIAEIRDATHLIGKNTFDTDHTIKGELLKKEREVSVLSIGPAGENLVKFALISVDRGHMASKNGVGAVMGSKKLKAIAVERGNQIVQLVNKDTVSSVSKSLLNTAKANKFNNMSITEGTVGGVVVATQVGFLPVKNYTTSINFMDAAKLDSYSSKNIREKFKAKNNPCWACSSTHCHIYEINDDKYGKFIAEEPEYEGMAACSSVIGLDDVNMSVIIASTIDRLGLDINETGWLIGWLMECHEKNIITKKDTDGIEIKWGNGEAVLSIINKIAKREGIGNILAEGVMRAAKIMDRGSELFAIHSQKGNTPRGHDHRSGMWFELFDTCVSNLGTVESYHAAPFKLLGLDFPYDVFDPEAVSTMVAKVKGAMIFEDSLVTCRFQTCTQLDLLCQAVNSATGWNIDINEAMKIGKRAVNLARIFNLRNGIDPELDAPSPRYGSTPIDGKAAGIGIMDYWDKMLKNYYFQMGWDEKGIPLMTTLKDLDIEESL